MLLSFDAFAFFLLMVKYQYSHQTLRTPPDLSGGLQPTLPLCPKSLMNFPLSKMPPVNGNFHSVSSAFYFSNCMPYFHCMLYRFEKCLDGMCLCLSRLCEPRKILPVILNCC